MKVLVAGGTGVVGQQLVPLLLEEGHDVVTLAGSSTRASSQPADTIVANALDRDSVVAAVGRVDPDAVIQLLTAIPRRIRPRNFARDMATTNRLRSEGTRHLLAAAPTARLITQGVAFLYEPAPGLASEARPLWETGPRPIRPVVEALRTAEQLTLDAGGAVLRFGHLYGPHTHLAHDGDFTDQVRRGRMPLVAGGASVFSFTHTADAARAVVTALRNEAHGIYNVDDDEPAPLEVWLPEFARLLGAPSPRRVPGWAASLLGGSWGRAYLGSLVGADNRRATEELGWRPSRSSWRGGFPEMLNRVGA
ncbi:NAD(P)-dependent oxidoreductase [Nocardioides sp.]|uniref:NAD-dependent epimerase/dehydratase family protein n=1 Tax=Nocardioides sp. TaxID=35761 RepID=UPI002733797F|nr:NAD(P)-dependent oxidoreductase [Nocardioides sp.]MDP3890134.1 NAD(P)-dependent oxidoreductase [Nocardioides sp.]